MVTDEPVTMETLLRRVDAADKLVRAATRHGMPVLTHALVMAKRDDAIAIIDSVTVYGGDLFGASVAVGTYELIAKDADAAWPDPQA